MFRRACQTVGSGADDGLVDKEVNRPRHDGDCVGKCYSDGILGKGIDTRVHRPEYITLAAGRDLRER